MAFPDDLLFDPNKCPIESVAKVDFDFISDCAICPAPEPVFDCPDLEIPPEFPIPISPCPNITSGAGGFCDSNIDVSVITFTPPANPCPGGSTASMTCDVGVESTASQKDGVCDLSLDFGFVFDFDFDFCIPVEAGPAGPAGPCPTIFGSADATAEIGTVETADASLDVLQVGECEYFFDFHFILPYCVPAWRIGHNDTTQIACTAPAEVTVEVSASGDCGVVINFDWAIPSGCPGVDGVDGMDGDKYAIVPLDIPQDDGGVSHAGYAGLMCVEQPETRFEDIITMPLDDTKITADIDPRFTAVCEPGSIKVIALAPSHPVAVGARVENDKIVLEADSRNLPLSGGFVNVKLSGIRKGRAGIRFPTFTKEERARNMMFWSDWNTQ